MLHILFVSLIRQTQISSCSFLKMRWQFESLNILTKGDNPCKMCSAGPESRNTGLQANRIIGEGPPMRMSVFWRWRKGVLNCCLWVCPNTHTCGLGHFKLIVLHGHYIHISNTASGQYLRLSITTSKSRDVKKNSVRKIIYIFIFILVAAFRSITIT